MSSACQILKPNTVFTRSAAVVTRTNAGETLLIPVRGAVGDLTSIYGFNETASTIWEALVEPKQLPEIVNVLIREYNVTESQATSDVQEFLKAMTEAGLVSAGEAMPDRLSGSGNGPITEFGRNNDGNG